MTAPSAGASSAWSTSPAPAPDDARPGAPDHPRPRARGHRRRLVLLAVRHETVPGRRGPRRSTPRSPGCRTTASRRTSRASRTTRPRAPFSGRAPSGGTEADKGSTVQLFVSKGAEEVTVPNTVGVSETDARDRLAAAGLTANVVRGLRRRRRGPGGRAGACRGNSAAKGSTVTAQRLEGLEARHRSERRRQHRGRRNGAGQGRGAECRTSCRALGPSPQEPWSPSIPPAARRRGARRSAERLAPGPSSSGAPERLFRTSGPAAGSPGGGCGAGEGSGLGGGSGPGGAGSGGSGSLIRPSFPGGDALKRARAVRANALSLSPVPSFAHTRREPEQGGAGAACRIDSRAARSRPPGGRRSQPTPPQGSSEFRDSSTRSRSSWATPSAAASTGRSATGTGGACAASGGSMLSTRRRSRTPAGRPAARRQHARGADRRRPRRCHGWRRRWRPRPRTSTSRVGSSRPSWR